MLRERSKHIKRQGLYELNQK